MMANSVPKNWRPSGATYLQYLIKLIPYGLLHLLRLLSGIFPRSRKTWLFWHRNNNGFADNSKYFFLYCSSELKGIKAVWLTDSDDVLTTLRGDGKEAYKTMSLGSWWYQLRAKFYFCDEPAIDIDRHFWLSKGAIWFNLWHGIPLKKIGYDNEHFSWVYQANQGTLNPALYWLMMYFYPWSLFRGHYTIALSKLTQEIFSRAFRIPLKNTLVFGYPRCDVFYRKVAGVELLSDSTTNQAISNFKAKSPNGKVVLYAPTFRDNKSSNIKGAGIDLSSFNQLLKDKNSLLVTKYHPRDTFASDEVEKGSYSHIINAPRNADMNHLLSSVDVLITDYSSVYFDFLLKDKPIIFYAYDLAEYLKNERDMYFDYADFTPGPKVTNYSELEAALSDVLSGKDTHRQERQKLIKLCYDQQDGNAAKRLAEFAITL